MIDCVPVVLKRLDWKQPILDRWTLYDIKKIRELVNVIQIL